MWRVQTSPWAATVKAPVVREEVRVRKEPVVEQRTASAQVRREEAHVQDMQAGKRGRSAGQEGVLRAPGRDDPKRK